VTVGVTMLKLSAFITVIAIGGVTICGNETAPRLGLGPGKIFGKFKSTEVLLGLKAPPGLGDLLVDNGEVDEEGEVYTGLGAMMLISSSSPARLAGERELAVRISAAESRTDGTECSRVSEL